MYKNIVVKISLLSLFLLFTGCVQDQVALKNNGSTCNVVFSKGNGQKYDLKDIRSFVVNEIRPELIDTDKEFPINIEKRCNGVKTSNIITMNAKNYYLTQVNGQKLPSRIETYNNTLALTISQENFINLIDNLNKYKFDVPVPDWNDQTYKEVEEVYSKQKTLKMIAFVLAESARFEDAAIALDKVFKENCTISWHDFNALVHNWRNSSDYVTETKTLSDKQYIGGGHSHLYAPITSNQIESFVKDLQAGKNYNFYHKAPFFGYYYECK
jgi:hypothetical protein